MMAKSLPTVDSDRLVADLANMVRIPSVNPFGKADAATGSEAAMADYLEERLLSLGLSTDTKEVLPGRRNVWGTLKGNGTGPTILLAAHLDTVGVEGYADPFDPRIEDGKLFGRGSCDMKAGLAAYLEVVRLVMEEKAPLTGDLIIAGLVDEEHAMLGSEDFGISGPKADFAIVAEPSELAVCPTHKGQIIMTIKTFGIATHSSMPEKGVNAIYHMALVIQKLQLYAKELGNRPPDPLCGTPSLSVGMIRGGTDACSVPDHCEVKIDRRTIPGENNHAVMAEIHAILTSVEKDVPAFQFEITKPILDQRPLSTPTDGPLTSSILSVCNMVRGATDIRAFPGSTDAPNLGCPTIICGPGHLEQCHSLNEYVEISQIEDAALIYFGTIKALQELTPMETDL